MTRIDDRLGLVLAVGVVALSLALRLNWVSYISDDGLTFATAAQTADGAVPYRDFFMAFPPGMVWIYGLAFKLFGESYLAGRLLTATGVLIAVAALWAAARSLLPAGWATAVAVFWGVWASVFLFTQPHHYWSMTLPLVMAWALLRGRRAARPELWHAAAGLAAAAACLTDQTSALPALGGLLAAARLGPRLSRGALPFLAALGLVGLGALMVLVLQGTVATAWKEVVLYPATTIRDLYPVPRPLVPYLVRDLKSPATDVQLFLPALFVWLFGVAVCVPVAGAAAIALARPSRLGPEAGILCVVSTALTCSVLFVRPTGPFLWLAAGLPLVLFATLAAARLRARRAAWLLPAGMALLALQPFPPSIRGGCGWGSDGTRLSLPAAGSSVCVRAPEAPSLAAAIAFADARPTESVAFLPFITPLYPLTARRPPLAYSWVAPDTLSDADLGRLEGQLGSGRVDWVIYAERISTAGFHAGSSQRLPDGRWALEGYLDGRFTKVGACGAYRLYSLVPNPPTAAPCGLSP